MINPAQQRTRSAAGLSGFSKYLLFSSQKRCESNRNPFNTGECRSLVTVEQQRYVIILVIP